MDTSKSVALKYAGNAPKIVAKAQGALADKLIDIAKKNNISIFVDSDLAEILFPLKIGSEIPDNLFYAVVKVFAYCYEINNELKQKIDRMIENK